MKRILKQILIIMLALISAALILFVLVVSRVEKPRNIIPNSNTKDHEVPYFDCAARGDTITSFTYSINDVVYPIFINPRGDCYIIRTSKNGIQYMQFLPKELCLQICAELNIEYQK